MDQWEETAWTKAQDMKNYSWLCVFGKETMNKRLCLKSNLEPGFTFYDTRNLDVIP